MSDGSSRSPFAYVALGLAAGVVLTAGGGYAVWRLSTPGAPLPTPAPPTVTQAPATQPPMPTPEPSPVAEAAAAPAPSPAAEAAAPKPKPAAPRPAGPPTAAVAALLTKAETAVASQKYDDATSLFDQILKQDPENGAARAGRAAASALQKTFIFAMPSAENVKGAPGRLEGFDAAGVDVKRAPEVPGRVDFEVAPSRVKPGDNLTVKVYLLNTGKKTIKVKEVSVIHVVNGARTSDTLVPKAKEVPSKQRVLVQEIRGVWAGDTTSWQLEVLVKSGKSDSYQNEVVWQ